MKFAEFLNKIPKIELHNHLEGTVKPETFIKLAVKHNIQLPDYKEPEDLYSWVTLPEFLKIYQLVEYSIREREEFHQVAYEALEEASKSNVRYIEMFWSPIDHLDVGVPYKESLDGIIDGIRDAKMDFGIECRLICSINRERSAEKGIEIVELMIKNRREEVIGIGLEYDETHHPPEKFVKAYQLAERAGFHRTAHACEFGGPPKNVETCLDLLHCERIDHGYRILEDDQITQRCVDEGIVFTCAPLAHRAGIIAKHGVWDLSRHPMRDMYAKGLKIMINTDDPGMVKANLSDMYTIVVEHMGFGFQDLKQTVMNSIHGAWISDDLKRDWSNGWGKEIDELIQKMDAA